MILQAKNISKQYGKKNNPVYALKGIDISIESASFTSIMGKSGSGKSTLLHILAGILSPTDGEVWLEETNIYRLSDSKRSVLRRKRMGFIFQFFNLFPEISVYDNIVLPLKVDRQKIDKGYVDSIINELELSDKIKRYPGELSGGQQQRVAIARSLVSKPAIIFADEPTGNLDEATSKEVMNLLLKTQKQFNQTIVLVTHDKDIASYGNRTIVLSDGKIQEEIIHEES